MNHLGVGDLYFMTFANKAVVQVNLFPKLNYEDKDIKISRFYEPASECGGNKRRRCGSEKSGS